MTVPDHTDEAVAAELFADIVELPLDARDAMLEASGASDAVLRRVKQLLQADDDSGSVTNVLASAAAEVVLDRSADSEAARTVRAAIHPEAIDGYTIARIVGIGTTATVFEARRPDDSKPIALKLFHVDLSAASLEREVRAATLPRHAGLAPTMSVGIFDGPIGRRPYLTMPLITGATLGRLAANMRPDVRRCLRLVSLVADALSAAHREGVVHGDIKPSNIIVDEGGMPVVVDFGVARVATSEVVFDGGAHPGTIPYMSPRRLARRPPLPEDDLYALGVVAFELLVGARPFATEHSTRAEAASVLRSYARLPVDHFDRRLSGEVTAIIDRMTAVDPRLRYESLSDASDDIRRYLGGQPVRARPLGPLQRFRLWRGRHRGLVAGLTIAGVAVVVVIATIVWAGWRAAADRDRLAAANRDSEILVEQLGSVVRQIQPSIRDGQNVDVIEVFVDTLAAQLDSLGLRPRGKARLADIIGNAYHELGRDGDALTLHESSLRIRERLELDRDVATSLNHIALALAAVDRLDEAESALRRSIEIRRRLDVDENIDLARAICNLSDVVLQLGRRDEALLLARESLEMRRRLDADASDLADALNDFALALGDPASQIPFFEEAYDILVRSPTARRTTVAAAANNLGLTYTRLGERMGSTNEYERALPYLEEAVRIRRHSLGDGHADTLQSLNNLAIGYHGLGQHDAAAEQFRAVLDASRLAGIDTFRASNNLIATLQRGGFLAAAEEEALIALKHHTSRMSRALLLHRLAETRIAMGDFERAIDPANESLQLHESLGGGWRVLDGRLTCAWIEYHVGESGEAIVVFATVLEDLRSNPAVPANYRKAAEARFSTMTRARDAVDRER